MVRVGGGWDTLEHYLLRHDPKQVTVFNLKSADPFLHIRAKYCSPTQSQASSTRGSPTHSRATPSRVTLSGDPSPGNSSSEGTPPPPQEPHVPPSPPAVSSMPATVSNTITDSSIKDKNSSIPKEEYSAVTVKESSMTKSDSRNASFIPCSINGTVEDASYALAQDMPTATTSSSQSQSNSVKTSSPTTMSRPIVNSSTFCIEDHNLVDPLPSIIQTSHSKSPSTSSTSSSSSSESSSSSDSSSCSLKVTPPPTPSTFSTPACATSAPLDLSLTTNGSSTTLGTPLPTDSIDHEEL
ncbi:GAS2-like protein 1-like [Homarus americanus]|uniref:GAS2-like protein 1-like n=2 Tax=Homarus americanus TaxID=6706 RepID=A0A8J5KFX0_HOMAM|nr:GAS2-like protein 1-like [Homarus americanus]